MAENRRITEEEEKILERMQAIRKELKEIKDEKYLLEREYANLGDTRKIEKVAPFVWGALSLFWAIILIGDIVVGWYTLGMAIAIALASALPALFIFTFVMFIISLRRYVYANSSSPSVMQKAIEKGIRNRAVLQMNAMEKKRSLELRELDLNNEKESIQEAYDKASAVEWR